MVKAFITSTSFLLSDTKYRDIADGNPVARSKTAKALVPLETKYRDIADGNLHDDVLGCVADEVCWEPRGFLARMQTRNPITTYPKPTCVSQT